MSKKAVVVLVAMTVAALHFIVGPAYGGPLPSFVNGYLIDIVLPFSMFLLAGLVEHRILGATWIRALSVFGVGVVAETLQAFGIEFLGATFDPLDYAAYGIGVASGILFERFALSRLAEARAPRAP